MHVWHYIKINSSDICLQVLTDIVLIRWSKTEDNNEQW